MVEHDISPAAISAYLARHLLESTRHAFGAAQMASGKDPHGNPLACEVASR